MGDGLGGKVAIIGSGVIKYGENFPRSLTDMIYEAVTLALRDAKIERNRLQAAWLGCDEPMRDGFERTWAWPAAARAGSSPPAA